MDRREAILILLATNITESNYSRLVEALCQEHNIRLLKIDSDGTPRKVVGCGVVAVTDYGETDSQAMTII